MQHIRTNRTITFALAAMSAINHRGLAQVPNPDFTFQTVVATGAIIDGITLDNHARLEGAAISDNGSIAFLIRWYEQGGLTSRASLFTTSRFVVAEGAEIEGKTIKQFYGKSLAINNRGELAYLALYSEGPGARDRYGLFFEQHLVRSFDPGDPHIPLFGMPVGVISLTDDGIVRVEEDSTSFLPAGPPPANVRRADGLPQGSRLGCKAPSFPKPAEWDLKGGSAAPIHGLRLELEGPPPYDSPVQGHIQQPRRFIYFARDCSASIIEIRAPYSSELWTPAGLLGWSIPDKHVVFKGFDYGAAILGNMGSPSGSPFQVNSRGQVLLSVVILPQDFALLLGTPIAH